MRVELWGNGNIDLSATLVAAEELRPTPREIMELCRRAKFSMESFRFERGALIIVGRRRSQSEVPPPALGDHGVTL